MKGMWGKIWLNVALGLITLLAISIFIASFIFYQNYKGQDFGLFSALNAVFSGLGFVVIAFTLIYQYKQLKAQQEQFAQQSFENTFFNMLATQRQIIDQIEYQPLDRPLRYKGRSIFSRVRSDLIIIDFFPQTKEIDPRFAHLVGFANFSHICRKSEIPSDLFEDTTDLNKIYQHIRNINDNVDIEKWGRFLYEFVKDVYFSEYDHYYAHLYQILQYIYDNEEKEFQVTNSNDVYNKYQNYANIVQSQMSTGELFVLLSYSLCYPKMKDLLEHYKVLEELANNTPDSPYVNRAYNELYKRQNEN